MTYIPKGKYLTAEQYGQKVGLSRTAITKAARSGRLDGVVWLDARTVIIPEDAILITNAVKHGRYIGVSAWLRGEIRHQEELKDWQEKQEQLRRRREAGK